MNTYLKIENYPNITLIISLYFIYIVLFQNKSNACVYLASDFFFEKDDKYVFKARKIM